MRPLTITVAAVLPMVHVATSAFIHPGLLLKLEDIWRIAGSLNTAPWSTAWAAFKADSYSSTAWTLRGPNAVVVRDITNSNAGNTNLMEDANAAWHNALLWVIDHDETAAKKAVQILDAWGSTLKVCNGSDAQLAASLSGSIMVQAAELIRYTYSAADFASGWTDASIATFSAMLHNALVPPISQTEPSPEQQYPFDANWGSSAEKAMIAIGIFTDNTTLYELGKNLILTSRCANLTGNIAPSGQGSESGRDQQHTQLGLGNYAEAFQMLWIQGEDFYSTANNRLLSGYEYTAAYLGGDNTLPWDAGFYRCDANLVGGPWNAISPNGRDLVRPVFELAYAHYHGIKGLSMPYTAALIRGNTPDGENPANSVTDGVGFGTLLFRLNATV